jgi:uncharacterized damage-inducible protein DinB
LKQKTLSVFTRIERQRSEIISLYDGLSPKQLRYNPEPGKWNLLQVMRHLVTAERQSLIYIQRKLDRHETVDATGMDAAFRHLILRIALWLPIKFKAPKIADVSEDYPDYDTMKQEWNEVRSEFQEIIENSDDAVLTKALYRHPRAGLLNIKQALEFIEFHISHHQKQMNRIMNHSAFPKQ